MWDNSLGNRGDSFSSEFPVVTVYTAGNWSNGDPLRNSPEIDSLLFAAGRRTYFPERWASAHRFFVARRFTGGLTPTVQEMIRVTVGFETGKFIRDCS